MSRVKYYFTAILFCFLSSATNAQSDLRFINYTISDGLSQSMVSTILEDDYNGIWVGTQEGLNHFDGREFRVYNRENTPDIYNAYITSSAKTGQGELWFGTVNGLLLFNSKTGKFSTFFLTKKEALHIESIVYDGNEFLWLKTQGRSLLCFNIKTRKFISVPEFIPKTNIQFIAGVSYGKILISSATHGVCVIDITKKVSSKLQISIQNGNSPFVLMAAYSFDNNKKIIFSSPQGLFSYSLITKKVSREYTSINQKISSSIIGIQRVNNTWLFATNGQGLVQLKEDGQLIISSDDIFKKNSLLNNNISCLLLDNSGIGWVGSERGLSSFNPNDRGFFSIGPSINTNYGLPSQNVWSINESKNSEFAYIGTDLGLSKYNPKLGTFQHFYNDQLLDKGGGSVLSIMVLPNESLLLGCYGGLYRLNPKDRLGKFQKINFPANPKANLHQRIYSILKYSNEEYFLATNAGVILWNEKSGKTIYFTHDNRKMTSTIKEGICRTVFKDKQGTIFFSTSSGGLSVFDASSMSIKPFYLNDKIFTYTRDIISSICQTGPNEYYLGTLGEGILKFNTSTLKGLLINKKQGLPNNVIYGILPDENNNLWVSTNRGIAKYNLSSGEIKKYDELNGLICNEFNSNAYFKSRNGNLFFGGIYGCNYFHPYNIVNTKQLSNVLISSLLVDANKQYPKGKEFNAFELARLNDGILSLDYRQRSFTVFFQPTNLCAPELIVYKYILEGEQIDTKVFSHTNSVNFNALSFGKYTLKIYARIGDGPWSKVPATLVFVINPPYWATFLFWAIVVLLIFFSVYFIIRNRINQTRRDQVRLEMKIAERTREIRLQKSQIEIQNSLINEEKNKVIAQQKLLFKEKEIAEKWLKNALPVQVVKELNMNGKVQAKAYEFVTLMFTDVVGFTKIAESMSASRLVSKLDVIFRKFDTISSVNNLEKIKTIGDAYMVAGGIPEKNSTHPIDSCIAALQIQDYMNTLKYEAIANGKDYWQLRVGINSGPVTAGIIGKLKIAYDVWGATVNQAQRMEMLGEPGKVTISESTFNFIEPYFECEYKGRAQTKSKAMIDMYVVHAIKAELSLNGEGLKPNDRFYQIVQLHFFSAIKYYKAEHEMIKKLTDGLQAHLLYHSVEHTKDVVRSVERIAFQEGITDEGLFLLKTAALFHDAGFLKQYESNEAIGAKMAADILPKYGYTEQHIKTIVELIHVTEIPHKPLNHLQEIMCDADLDYLGRNDFQVIADNLKAELKTMNKINSDRKWDENQVRFLNQHTYFTPSAIKSRALKKQENLAVILARLEENNYTD
ncbi:MAG: triple tyrosine motif-containing protein [Flavobacteriia bacterium]|nr:triple tyrosine motif-containing protein [Flavobacteriia bacterium]